MIEFQSVGKKYGQKVILKDITFVAKRGEITGLIGPNGSGKSTLMRILLGLEKSESGRAIINGKNYRNLGDCPYETLGSFLDIYEPYPTRTALQHLRWIALACGVSKERCLECLEIVGLIDAKNQKIKDYSLGMKQRLGLATAILTDPEILVLDEPINGLDPDGIKWTRDFLRDFVAEGKTVLMTSHYMSELEMTVHHIVGISNGHIVLNDTRETVLNRYSSFEEAYFDCVRKREEKKYERV